MNKSETQAIIKKLESIYPRGFQSDLSKVEYAEAIRKFDYGIMLQVVEKIKVDGVKKKDGSVNRTFMPTISEVCDLYRQLSPDKSVLGTKNDEFCYVCKDNGFVTVKHKHPELGQMYEYAYYCPYCNMGKQYRYDGRSCGAHKSPYYIEPITSVLTEKEIEELKQKNMAGRKIYADEKPGIQAALQSIGRRMPNITVMAEADDSWVNEIED